MSRWGIVAFVLTVVGLGCATHPPADLSPVTGFDLNRYLGEWYEIARLDHRFERGLTNVTAQYALNDDGTVSVLNRGYDARKGEWQEAEGKARFRGERSVGSLEVSFFGPFYGGYHIVALDPDYQYAVVAGPSKDYFWILARSPEMEETTYARLVQQAEEWGFPTEELIRVSHVAVAATP